MQRMPWKCAYLSVCIAAALASSTSYGYADTPADESAANQAESNNTAADGKDRDAEVVEITASRRVTNLMKTPIAVTAISDDELKRDNASSLADLANNIPNVAIGAGPKNNVIQVGMRGIISDNDTEMGDPSVGIHLDGVYIPRPQAGFALIYDVERVEVSRGPQGTLYGRNSTVGAFNLVSKRPQFDETTHFVQYGVGNYNADNLRYTMNVPVTDTFAVRFNYFEEQRDGWVHQTQDLMDYDNDGILTVDQRYADYELGPEDYYYNLNQSAWRFSALYQPTDAFKLYVAYDRFNDNGAGHAMLKDCDQAAGTLEACTESFGTIHVNVPGKSDTVNDTYRIIADWNLNDNLTVSYLFGYQDLKQQSRIDIDAGQRSYRIAINPIHFTDMQLNFDDFNSESTTHELQFKSAGDQKLDWIVGLYTFREELDVRLEIDMPHLNYATNTPGEFIGVGSMVFDQPNRSADSDAIFGTLDYELTERWDVTLGYRYTEDKRADKDGGNYAIWSGGSYGDNFPMWYNAGGGSFSATEFMHESNELTTARGIYPRDAQGRLIPRNADNTNSSEYNKGTWKVGAAYETTGGTLLYGNIATGYRGGGFQDKVAACDCFYEFGPESTISYELGSKGLYLDGDLNIRTSLFFMDYTDKQVATQLRFQQPDGRTDVVQVTQNAGEVEIWGAELEYSWLVTDNGRLFGFVAYLDNEIKDFGNFVDQWFCDFRDSDPNLTDCGIPDDLGIAHLDVKGNKLPRTPEWMATVTYEHVFDLPGGYSLQPRITYSYTAEQFLNANNFDEGAYSTKVDAFDKVDALLRLEAPAGAWYVDVWVDNATDDQHQTYQERGQTADFIVAGYTNPRFYGINVGANF